jgi:signal transduction histidine kinase
MAGTVQGLGEARHRVHLEFPSELPPTILVDGTRFDQILRNLLHNALKFSPAGTPVELGAWIDGSELVFSVTDHGVGIAPEEQARIFERFHQADSVNTRNAEGAGLGLYITRQLVEAMDGAIDVRSTPGEGSTFTVRLPAQPRTARAPRSGAARVG